MSSPTLMESFGPNATRGEYAGSPAITGFGEPQAELAALLQGAGVAALSWRARLVISGEDRSRWLNAMVTNNTRDLPVNHGNYNFALNAQGRIQFDLTAWNRGEIYMLETEAAQAAGLTEFFDRYIIMDDVELTDISDRLATLAVIGPRSLPVLERTGFNLPALRPGEIVDVYLGEIGCSVARMPEERFESYEIWCAPQSAQAAWNALRSAGATAAGATAIESHRVLMGIPRIGLDIRERELAQETGQLQAVHHSKGCYLGQEIVERVHSRGAVHRQFCGFQFDSALPASGEKIFVAEKEVGEVTTVREVDMNGTAHRIALGYLRREHAAPGTEILAGTQRGKVAALPFSL